ncbi:MAG: hypothetical protein JO189_29000 [Deltaproteobacteria bacterium]|nr:hypothetical protein [Deltaproteobacteria bacterium]
MPEPLLNPVSLSDLNESHPSSMEELRPVFLMQQLMMFEAAEHALMRVIAALFCLCP